MENLLIYFVKANGLIILFYLMYVLFLRKETFFNSNRWYLIIGLLLSLVLPLITFTKTIWIEPTPLPEIYEDAIPITYNQTVIPKETVSIDWSLFLSIVYVVISILILVKIGIELIAFFSKIQKHNKQKNEAYTLVETNINENPFSFFRYIVINKDMFTDEEIEHILTHESIHVNQKHSFDVLLGKLFCAFFWANPIIWLYRKAMLQNLEFIADNETFLQIENKYAYQKTLLKVVINKNQSAITNQFFQSLIKKRIVMLNTNQSHKKKSWKYALILPFLIAFTLLFQIETVAQTKETKVEETTYAVSSSYSSVLTKNTTDQEIKELEETFSGQNHKLKISNVKRNKNNEIIAIKLEFDYGKTYNRVMERKSDNGINSIKIYINSDENDDLAYGFEDADDLSMEVVEIDGLVKDITKSKTWSLNSMKKDGKEVVLIVNGKIKAPKEKVEISFDEELGEMKEISMSEFEKKYNKKADKDKLYYEVKTFKLPTVKGSYNELAKPSQEKEKTSSGYSFSYETSGPERNVELIKENKTVDFKKALIIFDGKEIKYPDLDKIDPLIISLVSTLPGTDYVIKKYGEGGKNGVIIIESQEYYEKNNPDAKVNYDNVDFKLMEDNDGFIISKNSREEDLVFYKLTLAKSNIDFKYSGIKRNEKGEITSISINLKQKEKNGTRKTDTSSEDDQPNVFGVHRYDGPKHRC